MSLRPSPSTTSRSIEFVDTHCHLDGEDFVTDLPEVLQRASEAGVRRFINVGYSPQRWSASIKLSNRFQSVSYMLGVHPGHAAEWTENVEKDLRDLLESQSPVAIGEIGLDFYRGETNHGQQVEAFTSQLAIAFEYGLPVSIHMRNAEDLIMEVLDDQDQLPTLLFHSFEGSQRLADWIKDHNAWIGVGGLATRGKSSGLRQVIASIGLHRVVLETDSPYLVPNGFKHQRNTPESIPVIARSLVELFAVDFATIAERTSATANHIFWKGSAP
jgi:TatD DNase family protein